MNEVFMTGRLVRDPVRRETQNGIAVCNFIIAVPRPGTKPSDNMPDFHDCVVWRGGADVVAKYYHKGDGITVTGQLQTREWTDKDGNKRKDKEILVEKFEFPLSKKAVNSEQGTMEPETTAPSMTEVDEPLPF